MSKPRDHVSPGIPAFFVSQQTGIMMQKLMTSGKTLVRITPVRTAMPSLFWPLPLWALYVTAMVICACNGQVVDAVWMSMLLSAFAGVLAVTVVVATFYFVRCGKHVYHHTAWWFQVVSMRRSHLQMVLLH